MLKVIPADYYLWFRNRSGLGDETKCVPLCKLVEKSNITWAFEECKVLRIHGNSSPGDHTKDLFAEAQGLRNLVSTTRLGSGSILKGSSFGRAHP